MDADVFRWLWRHISLIAIGAGALGFFSGLAAFFWTRSVHAAIRYFWLIPSALVAGAIVLLFCAIFLDLFEICYWLINLFYNWEPRKGRQT